MRNERKEHVSSLLLRDPAEFEAADAAVTKVHSLELLVQHPWLLYLHNLFPCETSFSQVSCPS